MTTTSRGSSLAARHAIPTITPTPKSSTLGSHQLRLDSLFRLAGVYAGRVLNGEKPAELPVQESTKVELALNMKTAKDYSADAACAGRRSDRMRSASAHRPPGWLCAGGLRYLLVGEDAEAIGRSHDGAA